MERGYFEKYYDISIGIKIKLNFFDNNKFER